MTELDKLTTYSNRYRIIDEKLTNYIAKKSDASSEGITKDDFIYHIELLNQAIEVQGDIINVYIGMNKNSVRERSINNSALRIYAKKFGNHIISEINAPDGTKFKMTVTLIPLSEQFMSVDVKIEDEDYADQYFRRRTRYQKIRDWFVFLRQSFRKSQG